MLRLHGRGARRAPCPLIAVFDCGTFLLESCLSVWEENTLTQYSAVLALSCASESEQENRLNLVLSVRRFSTICRPIL